jgi:hypothetical protein
MGDRCRFKNFRAIKKIKINYSLSRGNDSREIGGKHPFPENLVNPVFKPDGGLLVLKIN